MRKINTANWKEFRVSDLFEQERGKEKAPKQNADGDCPLIQETNTNNGFDRYVIPTKVFKGNAITVSINYAQNVFYQKDDFCASVNIAILRNDHLNEYSGRFICAVLSSCHKKYDYVNKISKDKLNDEFIKLPAKDDGTPDYEYMEQYMRSIYEDQVVGIIDGLSACLDYKLTKEDRKALNAAHNKEKSNTYKKQGN